MKITIELDITPKGDKYWYKNGIRHRGNGQPSICYSNGNKVWFIDGMCIKNGK